MRFTPFRVVAAMVLAIALVALGAYWDAQRESAAALDDFASEQVTVASAVAAAFAEAARARNPPEAAGEVDGDGDVEGLLRGVAGAAGVERPGSVLVLARRAGTGGLHGTHGPVASAALVAALASGRPSARLSRAEAASLGLPARTAMAGFARADVGPQAGAFDVVVVATALRERDRELRAQWRLVLGVVVTSGLVLAFGGLALRKQREQLVLERELAVAALAHERDERLVRADKLATLGALASGVAHEISTPLSVILGRAEQLRGKVGGDERATRALEEVVKQGERIDAIVRGFLAVARGQARPMERVAAAAIARDAAALVEHRFAKAEVDLALDAPEPGAVKAAGASREIACDRRLLEQAVVNLLLNACDACDPGGHVVLRVGTSEHEGKGVVVFEVEDDGAGIAAEDAARVTEPFFTTKPEGKGTGLGLAITNEIVKHHHGTLRVAPRSPRGTRATIEVPS